MIRRLPIELLAAEPQINDINTLAPMRVTGPRKMDWRASLFDKFVPTGGAQVDDEDKKRLFRQGLLQFAAGMQSSSNPSIAFANGISGGLLSMNQGVGDIQDRQYKQQALDQRLNDPMEVRGFRAMTQGMSPEDVERARRIQLGLDPRAVTSAAKSMTVDINGTPTTLTFDPTTGTYQRAVLPDGAGGIPAAPPSVVPQNPVAAAQLDPNALVASLGRDFPGARISSTYRTPQHNREVGGVPNSYHLTGEAVDVVPRDPAQRKQIMDYYTARGWQGLDEGDHLHFEPPHRGMTVSQVTPITGRRKEDEAGAVAQAQANVDLAMKPRIEALTKGAEIDATNARAGASAATAGQIEAAKTAGQKSAERTQEAIAALPQTEMNADELSALINRAINHPGRETATGASSKWDPRNYVPGTDATDFQVLADQIGGKAFLQAFQSLKGSGAITEQEGAKATAAIARLNRAQSDAEYVRALRDLQSVVNNGRMRARQKAGVRPNNFAGFKVLD